MKKLVCLLVAVIAFTSCQQGAPPMGSRVLDSLYISGYGASAASGTVQFYQPGTLTPVTVYSDDALTQALAQPITLDANGKTPLPVYTAAPLRAIIKSAAGATLQDITRIDGDRAELVQVSNTSFPGAATVDAALSALGTSFGGINGLYLAPGTGAVPRTFQSVIGDMAFNVKNYGAIGNGVADDTSAIQATITACIAAGGGTVFLPPGTYLISSALNVSTTGISIQGASRNTSIIKNTNASTGVFTTPGSAAVTDFRNFRITHSSSSSATAIVAAAGGQVNFDTVSIGGHLGAVNTTSIVPFNSSFVATGAGTAVITGWATSVRSFYTSSTGTGLSVSLPGSTLIGDTFSGGSIGLDITSGGTVTTAGCDASACTVGMRTAASSTSLVVLSTACNWGTVTDQRTGPPVSYSFSTSSAITPLPSQTDTVRVVATAAITVTVNQPANTAFGRKWTLMCLNNSGGAVTWTFNAAYKLSAAVAPATGNMVSLILEYDPISGIVREVGRAATAI
jgi:hypothetical protein